MVTPLRRFFVDIVKIAGIAAWVMVAGLGVVLNRDQPGEWREMLAYTLIIPILLASFFYGRPGGLLTALVSSLASGSLAIGQPEMLQSPIAQRVLFQIFFFNGVALVTSELAEREKMAAAEKARLYQASLRLLDDLQRARDELAHWNVDLERRVAERTAELARRAEQLDLIERVGRRAISLLNLDMLLPSIAHLIRDTFGYYAVLVMLIDWEAGELGLSAAATAEEVNLFEPGVRLRLGQGLTGCAAASGEPVAVGDVSTDPRYHFDERLPRTRSELVLPLRIGDQVVGVLDLESVALNAFASDDVQVLQTLADQVAVAIHNARLYQAEQNRRRWAEALERAGRELSSCLDLPQVPRLILEQLASVVPYERGAVLVQEEDTTRIVAQHGFPDDERVTDLRLPIREGDVYGQVVTARAPVLIDDVTTDVGWEQIPWLPLNKSWMGVPLISKDQVIGMISLTRREAGAFSPDEATVVSTFAVQAAIALENAHLYDEIARFNEQLELMILQRTEELKQAYQTLEKIDKTRSDFIDIAAHELRTPLTLIRGYTALLEPLVEHNLEAAALVKGIMTGEQRLYELVNSLLDVSRITSRALEVCKEPVRFSDILRRVHSEFKQALQERCLTFSVVGLNDLPTIHADPGLLSKVFHHLVMNAIKYTPDGGSITVTGQVIAAGEEDMAVEVVVSDTGIGIDPADRELIFEKFFQTEQVIFHSSGSTKFKGGGPGLGLPIARGIVLAHGGRIWAESEGHDEERCPGSHFHVCLPVK